MSVIEVPVDVEQRIASAIRENVMRLIDQDGLDAAANKLGMHSAGLQSLLRSSRWNLPIAVRVAVQLGLPDAQRMEEALKSHA